MIGLVHSSSMMSKNKKEDRSNQKLQMLSLYIL